MYPQKQLLIRFHWCIISQITLNIVGMWQSLNENEIDLPGEYNYRNRRETI